MGKTISMIATLVLLAGLLWAADTPAGPAAAGGLITPEKAKALLAKDASITLLDVRTAEEFNGGHIPGAKLLPYDQIDAKSIAALAPDKKATIIVYCRSGRRSAIAAKTLEGLGYRQVFDLGGINTWPYEIVK